MSDVRIARLVYDRPRPVGTLSQDGSNFTYDAAYLREPGAIPLSLSLPLREQPFSAAELRPYFEGLLPEGIARQALAGELQLPEDRWVDILAACGHDCMGDVLVRLKAEDDIEADDLAYKPVALSEIVAVLGSAASTSQENAAQRLSLAGTQNKTGLARDPEKPLAEGWFRPHGLAATSHILKTSHLASIPENEYLCMQAARACGIPTATVALIDAPTPVLAVERFDRSVSTPDDTLQVIRLHQEDFAQALGRTPGTKYTEIEGGTVRTIAETIRRHSAQPARDLRQFAQMLCICYLIGNCDAHLKNMAFVYHDGLPRPIMQLAPAYDLVCTTIFPRFSRELAMAYGGIRLIDDVTPETFRAVAEDLGVTVAALKAIARPIAQHTLDAIDRAGEGEISPVLESTPYLAEGLIEDMQPRQAVLERFCMS